MTAALFKFLAALVVAGVAYAGALAYNEHYRAQGRAEVQAQWDAAEARRTAQEQRLAAEREQAERHKEQVMQRQHEQKEAQRVKSQQDLQSRIADLEQRNRGLLDAIAARDAASHAQRATGTCAAAESEAHAAAQARNLLAACATRYGVMAADAAGLAGQVIGLQDHITIVQPAAAQLLEPMP